jgi:hypothetical protein
VTPALRAQLGAALRESHYELKPLLTTLFLSKDFYSPASVATHIKSPVELVVSTYKKLGLASIPGVPDFNQVTGALGQHLFRPPTVAGWAQGKSWITPGLLVERGNFARDVLFPDITFIPPDRYPMGDIGESVRGVGEKIAQGFDISTATKPEGKESGGGMMAVSNQMADRDEDFKHPLCELSRLADGHREGQADSARYCAAGPDEDDRCPRYADDRASGGLSGGALHAPAHRHCGPAAFARLRA